MPNKIGTHPSEASALGIPPYENMQKKKYSGDRI
jgi:hypothetical protein